VLEQLKLLEMLMPLLVPPLVLLVLHLQHPPVLLAFPFTPVVLPQVQGACCTWKLDQQSNTTTLRLVLVLQLMEPIT
jgi:hypothetical protein